MNFLLLLTAPLSDYRNAFVASLKAHPLSTGDQLTVLCSVYEDEFNNETFDLLTDTGAEVVIMKPLSLTPYDTSRSLLTYQQEVSSNHIYRLALSGETCYVPLLYAPSSDKWSTKIKEAWRASGRDFWGETFSDSDTEDGCERAWMSGLFTCDGSFFTDNPCLRGHRKGLHFMKRARNYTQRSYMEAEDVFMTPIATTEDGFNDTSDIAEPVQEESTEPPVAPSREVSTPSINEGDTTDDVLTPRPPAKKATKKTAKKAAKKAGKGLVGRRPRKSKAK